MNAPASAGPGSTALALGYAGLLPFAAGAVLAWTGPLGAVPAGRVLLLAYAAVIVSFLGGIHWGLVMRAPAGRDAQLVWGVLPSLAAWLALLLPERIGLGLCALSLIACYAADRGSYGREGLAAWLPLRLRLTAVATLCCAAGAAAP